MNNSALTLIVMAMAMVMTIMLLTDATVVVVVDGFVPTVMSRISTQTHTSTPSTPSTPSTSTTTTTSLNAEQKKKKKKGNFFTNMLEELDAFMDDATARRLGNGAAYYGKRKSSFYGSDDKMKKSDRDISDSEEDYMINAGGNYKWVKDENGIDRPVSRMKGNSLEKKNPYGVGKILKIQIPIQKNNNNTKE